MHTQNKGLGLCCKIWRGYAVQFSCLWICNPLIFLLVPLFDSCNKWEGFHSDKSFVHTFAQQDLDEQSTSFSIFFNKKNKKN
jgi:hypothetical protein